MVLVIDFGSQYTTLLVKKIRNCEVYAELIDCEDDNLLDIAVKSIAIVISGSPESAKEEKHEKIMKELIKLDKPILAICYGMQVIHKMLGGELDYGNKSEFGETKIKITSSNAILDGIPPIFKTLMSHNDSVIKLAPGFKSIAKTNNAHAIAVSTNQKIYTIQFHPEAEQSIYGERLIQNFLFLICKTKKNWNLKEVITNKIEELKSKVGNKSIFLALSGGLDSSVVAKLIQKAKINAIFIFVDTGLMIDKKNKAICNYFKTEFGSSFKMVDASEIFLKKLSKITDPEEKRKIIGKCFADVFIQETQKHSSTDKNYLAQGTIYSDLIESGNKRTQKIKTHHNTVPDLKEKFILIEPLSDLFKSEVKQLAHQLKLPDFITNSQPFPGPGYAIRIIGEVTKEKVELIKQVDAIVIQKLMEYGIYWNITQTFTVLLDTKSVGVIGDQRNYGHVIAIRAIESKDLMTAKAAEIPFNILNEICQEIINNIPKITRVLFDLTSKPPSTIEWE